MDNPAFLNDANLFAEASPNPAPVVQLADLDLEPSAQNNGVTFGQPAGQSHGRKVDKESKELFLPINGEKHDDDGGGGGGDAVTTDGDQHRNSTKHNDTNSSSSSSRSRGSRGGDDDAAADDDDMVCGLGSCSPSFMQKCMSIGYFTFFYSFSGVITSALNSYMNSQITTLEKNYNFSSSFSGFLMSCNDLGYLLTTLFMSYYTRRVHIPRALSLSTIVFGLSGILCVLAFVVTKDETAKFTSVGFGHGSEGAGVGVSQFPSQMCENVTSAANATCGELSSRRAPSREMAPLWKWLALSILALGMFLQGTAKSPRHPFIGTYIDDNVPKTKTTVYLGIITGLAIVGPSLAFICGGFFSKIYVTLEETDMSVRDPRWIGAWWLGFLVFGVAALFSALPIACFPRRLRGRRQVQEAESQKHVVAAHSDEKNTPKVAKDIKGFAKSLLRLLTNPVYSLVVLATGTNLMAIAGLSFLPKYLETQFTLPVFQANMTLGIVYVGSAGLGTVVGGFVTSRLKLAPMTCLRCVALGMTLSTVAMTFSFLLGCDQPYIESGAGEISSRASNLLTSQCVAGCNCDSRTFFPVCGADNINYFSPCHAGCTAMDGPTLFANCSCVSGSGSDALSTTATAAAAAATALTPYYQTARAGLCTPDCNTFYPYILMKFLVAFLATITIMPNFVVYVRSVAEKDKPLAIGFMAFSATVLGWLPGPVIFGYVVDTTCLIWKTSCGSSTKGACQLYDLPLFRFRFHFLMVMLRASSILLFIIALLYATFSKKFKFQAHKEEKIIEAPVKEIESGTVEGKAKDNSLEFKLGTKL